MFEKRIKIWQYRDRYQVLSHNLLSENEDFMQITNTID